MNCINNTVSYIYDFVACDQVQQIGDTPVIEFQFSGKLGTVRIDLLRLALGILSFLAYKLVSGFHSLLFLGASLVLIKDCIDSPKIKEIFETFKSKLYGMVIVLK